MPAPGALHSVFVDPNPAVAAKCPFRALIAKNSDPMEAMRSAVWCSTDGVHWAENTGLSWVLPGVGVPEPPSFAFWNEVRPRLPPQLPSIEYKSLSDPPQLLGFLRRQFHDSRFLGGMECRVGRCGAIAG